MRSGDTVLLGGAAIGRIFSPLPGDIGVLMPVAAGMLAAEWPAHGCGAVPSAVGLAGRRATTPHLRADGATNVRVSGC